VHLKSIDDYKAQAKILKEFLKQKDHAIKHALSLEAVAKMHGFLDWNYLCAYYARENIIKEG